MGASSNILITNRRIYGGRRPAGKRPMITTNDVAEPVNTNIDLHSSIPETRFMTLLLRVTLQW